MPVDKLEEMLGSYAPHPEGAAYTKHFQDEESPSGMLARSGTYHVRSRVVDDDGEIYAGKFWRLSVYLPSLDLQ
jgi:Rho GDP-dissociation inhibitor